MNNTKIIIGNEKYDLELTEEDVHEHVPSGLLYRISQNGNIIGCISAYISFTAVAIWESVLKEKITKEVIINLFNLIIPYLKFPITIEDIKTCYSNHNKCIKILINSDKSFFDEKLSTLYVTCKNTPYELVKNLVYQDVYEDKHIQYVVLEFLKRNWDVTNNRTIQALNLYNNLFLPEEEYSKTLDYLNENGDIKAQKVDQGAWIIVTITNQGIDRIRPLDNEKKRIEKIEFSPQNTDINTVIKKKETDSTEFKSSLRWDYKQSKVNSDLEYAVIKDIDSFLNTDGGILIIGLDDDGNVLGLDSDYHTLSKKNRDGFKLKLVELVNNNLGKVSHEFIKIIIEEYCNKDICIIYINRSDAPVFIKSSNKEEFFIRASASSQPLSISEAMKYIKIHWEHNNQ